MEPLKNMLTTIREITPPGLNEWKRVYGMPTATVHTISFGDLDGYEIKFLAKVEDNKAYLVAEVKSSFNRRKVTIDLRNLLNSPVIRVAELIKESEDVNILCPTKICTGIRKVIEYFAIKQAEIHEAFMKAEESLKEESIMLYINDHKRRVSIRVRGNSYLDARNEAKDLGYLEDNNLRDEEDQNSVELFSINTRAEYSISHD